MADHALPPGADEKIEEAAEALLGAAQKATGAAQKATVLTIAIIALFRVAKKFGTNTAESFAILRMAEAQFNKRRPS